MSRRKLHAATLTTLVGAARGGDDQDAWNEIVRRFKGLVWKVGRSFDLSPAELDDHSARTWYKLVMSLKTVREAERLPGWVRTVASNEARLVIRERRRLVVTDTLDDHADRFGEPLDSGLLESEVRLAVKAALDQIPTACQQLLRLLASVPPLSYSEIAEIIGRPVGSIGPTQQRCLEKLRGRPVMAPYVRAVRR